MCAREKTYWNWNICVCDVFHLCRWSRANQLDFFVCRHFHHYSNNVNCNYDHSTRNYLYRFRWLHIRSHLNCDRCYDCHMLTFDLHQFRRHTPHRLSFFNVFSRTFRTNRKMRLCTGNFASQYCELSNQLSSQKCKFLILFDIAITVWTVDACSIRKRLNGRSQEWMSGSSDRDHFNSFFSSFGRFRAEREREIVEYVRSQLIPLERLAGAHEITTLSGDLSSAIAILGHSINMRNKRGKRTKQKKRKQIDENRQQLS